MKGFLRKILILKEKKNKYSGHFYLPKMDDGANSWIRRTKFSHTVFHRFDASRLVDVPFTIQPNRISGANSMPESSTENARTGPKIVQIQRDPTSDQPRTVSPLPRTKLSNALKEAQSSQKRFLSPHPQRKEHEKGIVGKLFPKDSHETKAPALNLPGSKSLRNTSPLKHFTSMKFHGKSKTRKEATWTKYFDHSGGRVTSVDTADEHMVDLSKLFLGLRFAHGAHSQLYHGIYMEEPVAVKIIRLPDNDENGALCARLEKQFTMEVILLSRLHHQNVIKFIAACRKPPVFCIVTEYLSEGSLRAYLHKIEHKSLPMQKLISLALDIAKGMEYIHSQGIIHRDLKPENVLITEDFHLKVADFGIACEEAYCDLLADDPGTYRWMAPEMIKRKHYGRKVDVYGFGLILWELVAGTIPYEDMTPIQAAFAVVNKNLRPVIPGDCPPAMKSLIEQCWSLQPDKRPEFWQIVKVLEEFQTSFARDGTLNLVHHPTCQDHKKKLIHWIHKLGPHQTHTAIHKT